MSATPKTTILLADEDTLRREGLQAILSSDSQLEVLRGVADGETAMEAVRELRPDVAVLDLNLPRLHAIELVRRTRAEKLPTKIIILSGTSDDEIIREVIRAGADGYLLKNGPARHLIDAISYVRDGGQYFSPQLLRDGRDRRLLQETPRRTVRTRTLRERIRDDGQNDLKDHDYEVMTMLADGIRPILDRLDEIDSRVAQMEEGAAPVPANPRKWLTTQFADTLRDSRSSEAVATRAGVDMETRLPEMIEEAVSRRFHQMAGKLQQEIEETHVRTLETFVKNIQVKLVQRVSALEHGVTAQARALNDLREYSQRTEDNLSRLIVGVDRLAQELPLRLAAAESPSSETPSIPQAGAPAVEPKRTSVHSSGRTMRLIWTAIGGVVLLCLFVWGIMHLRGDGTPELSSTPLSVPQPQAPKPPAPGADTKTKMQAAQDYVDRKDYGPAESIYKQVVASEPANAEALKALASVLFREDKIEESALILEKLPKE